MRVAPTLFAFGMLLASGCIGNPPIGPLTEPTDGNTAMTLAFSAPVKINAQGTGGYEPSIQVGPDGTLYATAHKSRIVSEGTRLASWFWYSTDNGATWSDMPSPQGYDDELFAFEGDIAIDAKGRVYFVDTYAADNVLSRWRSSPEGPVWEMTRPIQGTVGVDDRPWLAAHGDGIVYYLGNNGADPIAPNSLTGGSVKGSRIWLYASTDKGDTWSLGYGFEGMLWCDLAASPVDDTTVYVGCGEGGKGEVALYRSTDRGKTFTKTVVAKYAQGMGSGPVFPSTATDRAGNVYHAWIDDIRTDTKPGKVHLARSADGVTWDVLDVSPFEGTFRHVWVSGGEAGTASVVFYATPDVPPKAETEWFARAVVLENATGATPVARHAEIDSAPVGTGTDSPGHFFQNAIGPDNAVHVVYERVPEQDLVAGLTDGPDSTILHSRQIAGSNLAIGLASSPLPR